ncbi:hypothetical protein [Scytonema sp. NUACC26]|uniref:hypothetical protein n=1 Tax=Scytonema sp. NUACC26 TaxID=3140176 RepID=UPI0034DC9A63
MIFLSDIQTIEFSRKIGSKDKSKRMRRAIAIAGGVALARAGVNGALLFPICMG